MSKEVNYRKLYDSLKSANSKLHASLANAQAQLQNMELRVSRSMAERMAAEQIITIKIKQLNATMSDIQAENQRLREENKRLKDGTVH